jgi:hypothetical protein
MSQVLSLALQNGGLLQYGSQQADILLLPSSPSTKVRCRDGMKTRKDRLDSVADVPTDNREAEVTSALAFVGCAAACVFTDVFHLNDVTLYANLVLTSMVVVGVVDNLYDLLKGGTAMAAKSRESDFRLPDKESLPLSLGSGKLTGSVVSGLTRLLTVDAERESECEAAALFVAYVLGLPCFAFRPNALEGSVLVIDSTDSGDAVDSLDSTSGILRMLICSWKD